MKFRRYDHDGESRILDSELEPSRFDLGIAHYIIVAEEDDRVIARAVSDTLSEARVICAGRRERGEDAYIYEILPESGSS